jgi:hypothetical protein
MREELGIGGRVTLEMTDLQGHTVVKDQTTFASHSPSLNRAAVSGERVAPGGCSRPLYRARKPAATRAVRLIL